MREIVVFGQRPVFLSAGQQIVGPPFLGAQKHGDDRHREAARGGVILGARG
jgi:hypothetical protein